MAAGWSMGGWSFGHLAGVPFTEGGSFNQFTGSSTTAVGTGGGESSTGSGVVATGQLATQYYTIGLQSLSGYSFGFTSMMNFFSSDLWYSPNILPDGGGGFLNTASDSDGDGLIDVVTGTGTRGDLSSLAFSIMNSLTGPQQYIFSLDAQNDVRACNFLNFASDAKDKLEDKYDVDFDLSNVDGDASATAALAMFFLVVNVLDNNNITASYGGQSIDIGSLLGTLSAYESIVFGVGQLQVAGETYSASNDYTSTARIDADNALGVITLAPRVVDGQTAIGPVVVSHILHELFHLVDGAYYIDPASSIGTPWLGGDNLGRDGLAGISSAEEFLLDQFANEFIEATGANPETDYRFPDDLGIFSLFDDIVAMLESGMCEL